MAERQTAFQMLLSELAEQLSVTGKFRALLSQAGLKLFNMEGKKKKFTCASLVPHAIFFLCFGFLGVHLFRGRADVFWWWVCFFFFYKNFFELNCRSTENAKLLVSLCQNSGLCGIGL